MMISMGVRVLFFRTFGTRGQVMICPPKSGIRIGFISDPVKIIVLNSYHTFTLLLMYTI